MTVLTCLQQPPNNNIHLSTILPETWLYLPAYSIQHTILSACLHITRDTTILICLQQQPYNNTHLSTILPEIPTSTCLPFYLRYNYINLPTATTLKKHPPVYHTTRDTTVLTCLQQPLYNNNQLSTILPDTTIATTLQ